MPLRPRLDLGVRSLLGEWKELFARKHFGADLAAGLTVACIAIPLSLAIALASGVPPAVGLVTAIVAGIVCALFGGTPLQVSGPAAAMAVLVASIVQTQGIAALLVIGVGCGVLQLVTGVFNLGRYARLVPLPVIEGFTAGIGAIILVGQLPRALGLPPPTQSHVFDVITHVGDLLHATKPGAVAITLLTLGVIYGLPHVTKRVPAHLVAVVLGTILVAGLGIDIATIGEIPRSLPTPSLPSIPAGASLGALAGSTLLVFALASLETLLSASAVDKMTSGKKSDPDQELIGQGLGNMAVALFGGIPVTGVIARSGTNVQAGAKTRLSAIIHALAIILTVFAIAPLIEKIPIAALAGVLFSVAFRMLSPLAFKRLWKHSRADGMIYAVTFVTIVFVDLLEGVQWGILAALAIAAIRFARTRLTTHGARRGQDYVFTFEGPLTFLASLDVEKLKNKLALLERDRRVVFDVQNVPTVDASGTEMLAGLVERAQSLGLRPFVLGLNDGAREQFVTVLGHEAESLLVATEGGLAEALGERDPETRLRNGIDRYRARMRPRYSNLFQRLAGGQSPHTLLITCCDSRIDPTLITQTEPGELFIVREIGNIVPDGTKPNGSAVAAAIEYAVCVLGVSKIVVCGHSGCGAMSALVSDKPLPDNLENLRDWIDRTEARDLVRSFPRSLTVDEIAKLNALSQVDHVKTYSVVAERIAAGKLSVAAWYFDVRSGEVEEWSSKAQRFVPVDIMPDELIDEVVTPSRHGHRHSHEKKPGKRNGVHLPS